MLFLMYNDIFTVCIYFELYCIVVFSVIKCLGLQYSNWLEVCQHNNHNTIIHTDTQTDCLTLFMDARLSPSLAGRA